MLETYAKQSISTSPASITGTVFYTYYVLYFQFYTFWSSYGSAAVTAIYS